VLFLTRPPIRRLFVALTVVACCLAAGLVTSTRSSAQSQAELDQVRAQQEDIRAKLAEQNAAVDALLGEVGKVRAQEREVAGQLAKQQAELDKARAELATAREELAANKEHLHKALGKLRRLLVSIYRQGEPDAAALLLEADGVDELAATKTYLDHMHDYEAEVVGEVRDLRTDSRNQVAAVEASIQKMEDAKAAIEEHQAELASARAELEEREAALNAAQAERREQLDKLKGKEGNLIDALSTPAPTVDPATGETSTPAPTENVPPPNGSVATINSDGTATAPADAPQAVKDAIAAGNQITNTPYLYGGGHGSFDSPGGYDCSGSVSYALHGGGLLSTPLDSTGFMTWGDPGPGQWITVYSNPGHAYMVIAGIRFDTSGAPPRYQSAAARSSAGFVATHPPGY
jgi:cell wall-associated NlpC family hydrolase